MTLGLSAPRSKQRIYNDFEECKVFIPQASAKTLRKMLFSLAVWPLKFIWGMLFRDRDYLVSCKEQTSSKNITSSVDL